jgi:hypothetical protein
MDAQSKEEAAVFVFYFVYFFLQTLFFDIKCIRSVKIKVDRTGVDEECGERCASSLIHFFHAHYQWTSTNRYTACIWTQKNEARSNRKIPKNCTIGTQHRKKSVRTPACMCQKK